MEAHSENVPSSWREQSNSLGATPKLTATTAAALLVPLQDGRKQQRLGATNAAPAAAAAATVECCSLGAAPANTAVNSQRKDTKKLLVFINCYCNFFSPSARVLLVGWLLLGTD